MIISINTELLVYVPLFLQLIVLTLAVLVDSYISARRRRTMKIIIALTFSLVVQDGASYLLDLAGIYPFERTLVSIFGYSVRPLILLLYMLIVDEKKNFRPYWALAGVNVLIHLTALFSGICFSIDGDNTFHRGPLGLSCHIISAYFLFQLARLTSHRYDMSQKAEIRIPLFNEAIIIVSVLADTLLRRILPVSFLSIAMVGCNLSYYLWLHLQFVYRYEEDLQTEQRVQLMLSQIKPHFLYNALGAVEELCDVDPQAAKEATTLFEKYLRGNMSAISSAGPVPFIKELEHTKMYLEIEKLRFEDALQIQYDIACTDFFLPSLTLEPIVENAVKHGVRGTEDGRGTVTITTRRAENCVEISVIDDGPGFDPAVLADDSETHVGLRNVRERLQNVCGGTMRIESGKRIGTTVTLQIPD